MARVIWLVIALGLGTAAYFGWQKYGFLFVSLDLETVDTSDISLEEETVEPESGIDLGFIHKDQSEQNQEIDLDFLKTESKNTQEIDLGFMTGSEDEANPTASTSPKDAEQVLSLLGELNPDLAQLANDLKNGELEARTICVFDPVGRGGDVYEIVSAFGKQARDLGIHMDIKTFDNENVIIDSFKAGICDGAAITGLKARQFNLFTASIEAVGALPNYLDLKTILEQFTQEALAPYMQQGEYEVAAVVPIGQVYAFIRDRAWLEQGLLQNLQGKKVGVFEGDAASLEMVRQLGTSPVSVSTTSFAGKFNNGSVDIIFAPAVAYEPLELYQGLKPNGAILRYPLIQLTYQLIVRQERFPEGFSQRLRGIAYQGKGFALEFVSLTEKRIPQAHWYDPTIPEAQAMANRLLEAQVQLGEQGVYDANMLKLMRKARCKREPTHYECALGR